MQWTGRPSGRRAEQRQGRRRAPACIVVMVVVLLPPSYPLSRKLWMAPASTQVMKRMNCPVARI